MAGDQLLVSPGLHGNEETVTVLRVADSNAATAVVGTAPTATGTRDVVVLAEPLQFRHTCGLLDINGTTVDARCSVGLLTRNIEILGEGRVDHLGNVVSEESALGDQTLGM